MGNYYFNKTLSKEDLFKCKIVLSEVLHRVNNNIGTDEDIIEIKKYLEKNLNMTSLGYDRVSSFIRNLKALVERNLKMEKNRNSGLREKIYEHCRKYPNTTVQEICTKFEITKTQLYRFLKRRL